MRLEDWVHSPKCMCKTSLEVPETSLVFRCEDLEKAYRQSPRRQEARIDDEAPLIHYSPHVTVITLACDEVK
jgi:hypothetical protein